MIAPATQLIPRIWADHLLASLEKGSAISYQLWREEQIRHEDRMAHDPDYARAYELYQAENEAMSYWDALYANQLPEEEDDEW